ncbi:MAG: SMC family ATPase [Calditrichaeota bacterium]|nr:SMC family ATPase [Calditrichota bacterium]
MRPLKLTISAFGPYADKLELDFTCLEGKNLFLIHGPTGSGKTSILDAICYALYGETSGDVRNIKHLRSDHADINTETKVVFEFGLGDRKYIVERSPEQNRPKLRGSGETTADARAVLVRKQSGEETEDQILCSRRQDVTPLIIDLLGFRIQQFRQVIMLPQGDFRKLLSGTSERSKIFETLFQTAYYSQIQNALKDASKELEKSVDNLNARINALLSTHEAETVDEIVEMVSRTSEEIKIIESQSEILVQKQETSQKRVIAAYESKRILDEFDIAVKQMLKLQELSKEYSEKERRINSARKAELLREILKNRDNRVEEHSDALNNLQHCQLALISAQEKLDHSTIELKKQEEKQPELETAGNELLRLRAISEKAETVEEEYRKHTELKDVFEKLDATNTELAKKFENLEADRLNLLKVKDEAQTTAARLDQHKMILADLKDKSELLTDISARKRRLSESNNSLSAAQSAFNQIDQDYQHSRVQYDQLRIIWQQGQSAILASTLRSDFPCPVCGSTEHPKPATSEDYLPSEAELNNIEKKVLELETELNAKRADVSGCEKEVEAISAKIDVLTGKITDKTEINSENILEKIKEAEFNIREADFARSTLETSLEFLEKLSTKREAIEKEREVNGINSLDAKTILDKHTGLLQELEKQIPEDFRDVDILNLKLKKTEALIFALKEQFENASTALSNAEKDLSSTQATLLAAKDLEIQTATALITAKEFFNVKLESAGFDTELELLSAMLGPDEVSILDSDLRKYQDDCTSNHDQVKKLEVASKDLEMPDIDNLEEEADTIQTEVKINSQQRAEVQAQINQLKSSLNKIEDYIVNKEDVYEQYQIYGDLADSANGKNDVGITFQNFVLSTFLDDVLIAASERLKLMSKGRYTLYRTDESGDKRRSQGLDIYIDDSYTGIPRPVSTFSGGESFQASLALALGLTDVVQSHAGGIKLDTIFIDEGFGNLDTEALDLAFKALVDLQTSGRLVGIISHVPELKTMIPVRLEVRSDKQGSSAEFIL